MIEMEEIKYFLLPITNDFATGAAIEFRFDQLALGTARDVGHRSIAFVHQI